METTGNVINLTITSSFQFIELVASFTDNLMQLAGFDQEQTHWIGLSVRECVINAIKHGNKLDITKQVEVSFSLDNQGILISVRDCGEGFDFNGVPNPLDPTNLLNPNGRGIFYMRTFMDEVVFSLHPQGGTVVKMLKRKIDVELS